jgi:hypothetical protein
MNAPSMRRSKSIGYWGAVSRMAAPEGMPAIWD